MRRFLSRADDMVRIGIKQISIFILPLLLSSCAVYSTGFNCPDSRGARCMMLSEVDRQIDSGEIEEVYLEKKCKGKNCDAEINNVPKQLLREIHKVKIMNSGRELSEYQDGDNLYIK